MENPEAKTVLVLGASGGVGRALLTQALERGHRVVAQTRDAARLGALDPRVDIRAFDPTDGGALEDACRGCDAVLFALGSDRMGRTTLFSDTTRTLIAAMQAAGVRRLIAITGVGAGETRGHGGFVYDWIVFPFITRRIYVDKARQEALILASGLDWTIVRPAPFKTVTPDGPLHAPTHVARGTRLIAITLAEVARFILDTLAEGRHIGEPAFVGHGRAA
jgi:putative NADH-flavin reductase